MKRESAFNGVRVNNSKLIVVLPLDNARSNESNMLVESLPSSTIHFRSIMIESIETILIFDTKNMY